MRVVGFLRVKLGGDKIATQFDFIQLHNHKLIFSNSLPPHKFIPVTAKQTGFSTDLHNCGGNRALTIALTVNYRIYTEIIRVHFFQRCANRGETALVQIRQTL
jgi:hypothetical protein